MSFLADLVVLCWCWFLLGRRPAHKDWIIWYFVTQTGCAMRKVILRIIRGEGARVKVDMRTEEGGESKLFCSLFSTSWRATIRYGNALAKEEGIHILHIHHTALRNLPILITTSKRKWDKCQRQDNWCKVECGDNVVHISNQALVCSITWFFLHGRSCRTELEVSKKGKAAHCMCYAFVPLRWWSHYTTQAT